MNDSNEVEPAKEPSDATLQGREQKLSDDAARAAAIEQAFDYRGDVTLDLDDGTTLTGYIFDRRAKDPTPHLRLLPTDSEQTVRVNYASIARLVYSGRDTAAGKSWETWVKKYKEKKAKGEEASIHTEPLE